MRQGTSLGGRCIDDLSRGGYCQFFSPLQFRSTFIHVAYPIRLHLKRRYVYLPSCTSAYLVRRTIEARRIARAVLRGAALSVVLFLRWVGRFAFGRSWPLIGQWFEKRLDSAI